MSGAAKAAIPLMRWLAVDLGARRIGLALSDAGGQLATPWRVLESAGRLTDDAARIARLAAEEAVGGVVVGLPLHMDGRDGTGAQRSRAFARALCEFLPRVELFDERLSSFEADTQLAAMNLTRAQRQRRQDALAAAVILRSFLHQLATAAPPPHAPAAHESAGTQTIPPELYDIAFAWDPNPEIERLLFLARVLGAPQPGGVLELGSGTGRLLRAWAARGVAARGIELSAAMGTYARARGSDVTIGDFTLTELGGPYDLIYASANTIRCIIDPAAHGRLWRAVAGALRPGGLTILDMELGTDEIARQIGRPARWQGSRDATEVRAAWEVLRMLPKPAAGAEHPSRHDVTTCEMQWVFEQREAAGWTSWRESFRLRVFEGAEFAATVAPLAVAGCYEVRDPLLLERPIAGAAGRHLVVLAA